MAPDAATPQDDSAFAPPAPPPSDAAPSVFDNPTPVRPRGPTACPHCGNQLVAHKGVNTGFFHCNSCGCCFDANGGQREGHPVCALAANALNARLLSQVQGQQQPVQSQQQQPATSASGKK